LVYTLQPKEAWDENKSVPGFARAGAAGRVEPVVGHAMHTLTASVHDACFAILLLYQD
jgi:hypothetical protein